MNRLKKTFEEPFDSKAIKKKFEEVFNKKAIYENFGTFGVKRKENDLFEIILTEEQNQDKENKLDEVRLRGLDEIYFAIKYDATFFLHRIENNGNDYSKSLLIRNKFYKVCDYIIWAKFQEHNILLIIELKSQTNGHVPEKFKSTKAFISYLNCLIEQYYNIQLNQEFKLIPLLINDKIKKNIIPINEYGFYHKGIGQNVIYDIKNDFEQILESENKSDE